VPEPLQNPGECPIQEDVRFQHVTWQVERLGWIFMALIVVAALAGLFGGPTTRQETRDQSGRVQIEYQHLQRHLDPAALRLKIDTQGQSLFELTIDKQLARAFEIRSVIPEPIETQAHEGGLLMKFAASSENTMPAEIVIMAIPNYPGDVSGGIGLIGEQPAHLDIFVYP
jgi:hypothetical protein